MGRSALIADRNGSLRHLIELSLGPGKDCQVLHADTGQDALRQAREARPDLVVLEVGLPELSGIELCRTIKADPELERARVVFVTAHVEAEQVARDAGADAFLAKPFSPRVLRETARALLRQAEAATDHDA